MKLLWVFFYISLFGYVILALAVPISYIVISIKILLEMKELW